MPNKKNNWVKEFRDLYFIWNCPTTPAQRENVKSMSKRVEQYIRTQRQDAIKEAIQEIEKLPTGMFDSTRYKLLIISKLKKQLLK
jgi:hypothetical protein